MPPPPIHGRYYKVSKCVRGLNTSVDGVDIPPNSFHPITLK
jgi:hypothetical protein